MRAREAAARSWAGIVATLIIALAAAGLVAWAGAEDWVGAIVGVWTYVQFKDA